MPSIPSVTPSRFLRVVKHSGPSMWRAVSTPSRTGPWMVVSKPLKSIGGSLTVGPRGPELPGEDARAHGPRDHHGEPAGDGDLLRRAEGQGDPEGHQRGPGRPRPPLPAGQGQHEAHGPGDNEGGPPDGL